MWSDCAFDRALLAIVFSSAHHLGMGMRSMSLSRQLEPVQLQNPRHLWSRGKTTS